MADLPNHPAKFSEPIMEVMSQLIDDEAFWNPVRKRNPISLLDPFAGTGRIHQFDTTGHAAPLKDVRVKTFGVELEPEWAQYHPATIVGNALHLPFCVNSMDVICTSPTYGNRMADHHEAKDDSKRMTYRHQLGRKLAPDNSGQMGWGPKYWDFHEEAWREATRVLSPGGALILNVKDFKRTRTIKGRRVKETVEVAKWHIDTICAMGYKVEGDIHVPVRGMGYGANGKSRVNHERVILLRRAALR